MVQPRQGIALQSHVGVRAFERGLPESYPTQEILKSLIVWVFLFCFRVNVHVKIPPLLSLRYGVSPSAKEVGEVMWRSPPLSFAAPLLRGRELSLLVVPSSVALFFIASGVRRRRHRLHPDSVADSIPIVGWSVNGCSRR